MSKSTQPAWWDPDQRKTRNQRSKTQELNRAKDTGGRVQAGSGSSWRAPQDVVTGEHLEELKFTGKSSYSIKTSMWVKLRSNAVRLGREPKLVIDFVEEGVRLIVTEEPDPGGNKLGGRVVRG